MLRFRLDRAFAHYAQTGDARSLARVFDGTAAELYRLGYHLLGDRHAAEDLVQQTFVVAIERAPTYERGRGVLSWLCGILTNRALQVRRQSRQRAGKGGRTVDVVADPVAEASAHELSATVVATVRSLPEPYRQVLLLHLVHELAPKEIADALVRADATVRTQLARGLDLLRKMLPAGIAGFAAGCVPVPLGLGAVRAAVLARVGDGAVGASIGAGAGSLAGVLAMKKVLVGLAVAFVVLATWPWWGGDAELPAAPARTGDGEAVAVAATSLPRVDPLVGGGELRVEVPGVDADPRAGLEVAVLWHDGTPAVDVTVRCRPRPPEIERWLHAAQTGSDGVVRFDALAGKVQVSGDRGGVVAVDLAPGAQQKVTLAIPRGIDLHGRVLDLEGRPIAGATVWLSVVPNSDDGEPVATGGPDGTFAIRSASAGHIVTATARGFGCTKVVAVDEKHAKEELVIVLRPAPGVLVGTVVDPGGRPIVGARVLVGVTMTDPGAGAHRRTMIGEFVGLDLWPSRFLRTDAVGQFRAEGLPPLPWPVWVGASGFGTSRVVADVQSHAETHVTITMQPAATVCGTVRDAAGLPVATAYLHALPQLPPMHDSIGSPNLSFPPLWMQIYTKTDAQGRYEIGNVLPGSTALRASLREDVATALRDVAVGETVVWNAVLAPPLSLHGCVVDGEGKPLAGWHVSLGDGTRTFSVRADAEGRFRLEAVADAAYRVAAQAAHPDVSASVHAGNFHPADSPIRIVVPCDQLPLARLRGRILLADGLPCDKAKVMVRSRDETASSSAVTEADGRYHTGALLRGTYRVEVDSPTFGTCRVGEFEAVDRQILDLGDFRVPIPGQLAVTTVDAAGRRVPVWVTACEQSDANRAHRGTLAQRDGISRATLSPGTYLVATFREAALAAIEVEVRSGQTTEVRLVVPDGVPFLLRVPDAVRGLPRLRQAWYDSNGILLRAGQVEWSDSAKEVPCAAPPGRYSLEVRDGDGRTARTTFDLRASDPPQVVELPLPGR